jgi:TatD DNase family protein
MAIYETHCHLNHEQFDADYALVVERALTANIRRLLVVSYDMPSSRRALSLSLSLPNVFAAIGIHPDDAGSWSDSAKDELTGLFRSHPKNIIAWGEIGLDYHWNTHDHAVQKRVFVEQLAAARELDLPVIIHCRDAYDDTLDILEGFGASRSVVVHCFTGTVDQARRAVALGCYIGLGGVLTYKNAANVRAIAEEIPLARILLETDSPYLAPQQWRGKRNEPAYLTAVAAKLAELRGLSVDEIESTTWQNATTLFG